MFKKTHTSPARATPEGASAARGREIRCARKAAARACSIIGPHVLPQKDAAPQFPQESRLTRFLSILAGKKAARQCRDQVAYRATQFFKYLILLLYIIFLPAVEFVAALEPRQFRKCSRWRREKRRRHFRQSVSEASSHATASQRPAILAQIRNTASDKTNISKILTQFVWRSRPAIWLSLKDICAASAATAAATYLERPKRSIKNA